MPLRVGHRGGRPPDGIARLDYYRMMPFVPAGPSSKEMFTMVGEGTRTVVWTHAASL